MLATMLFASGFALAQGDDPEPSTAPDSLGVTLSCTVGAADWLPSTAGCFLERRVATLGPLEVGIGIDARVAFAADAASYLQGYVVLAYYAESWTGFLEVASPDVLPAPVGGGGQRWRGGFTLGF